jgi:hypothetical protein
MSNSYPDPLAVSRRVLRLLIKLNVLVGFLILVLLIASLVAPAWVFTALGVNLTAGDTSTFFLGMRLIMLIGIASVPLAHVVLTRLLAIVDTVKVGDPFVVENAARLEMMAWAILGMELLHFAVGAIARAVSTEAQPLDLDWNFSLTRWLAVLLLFVLARVFEQGTKMREELEGTV